MCRPAYLCIELDCMPRRVCSRVSVIACLDVNMCVDERDGMPRQTGI